MEKIASEYLKNRNRLMSKIEVVRENLKKSSFKFINQCLLFQCSCVNIGEKRGFPGQ